MPDNCAIVKSVNKIILEAPPAASSNTAWTNSEFPKKRSMTLHPPLIGIRSKISIDKVSWII